ncbi:cytochrome P450 [Colletotrichum orchidophilum]|uniref:Cytochrome P450 monooxygenase ABA1 n=1 Tax=Colletotrichum orchidophilum TaxID=1209926 RepID=A0A1G4ASS9_9PEZI|nr:cytochrome P450 [Colletotrichum orchidophilum]OHE92219.1 cytochrome P450 [Colletotrichum orchidophilum]
MGISKTLLGKAAVPAVLLLLSLYIVKRVALYFKLRHFGGPWWTGVSHWPHSRAIISPNCHEWYAEMNEKHGMHNPMLVAWDNGDRIPFGPITRIAPGILITSSPELWAHVNRHPGYKRSDWYYHACRIEYQRDNVFTQTDNEKHEKRRKQMAPGYSGRENLDLEPTIDHRLEELLDLIRSKYLSSDSKVVPMDLAKKIQYFTLDVISAVGLGKAFGMLRTDSDVDDYLKSTEEGLSTVRFACAAGISWIAQSPIIGKFIAPSPTDNNGFGKMISACFRYVEERTKKSTDERSDMLSSFIRHGLSGDELKSEALEQIIAGSDTTAAAIRGTLLQIITNPRVYAKLQREIDEAVRDGKAPAYGDGIITLGQVKRLSYLQAVIRESLRVWPPVLNIFSRDVPAGGDTVEVNGETHFLPGGVCVGYSGYAMHRSEATYGIDSAAFRPERWFEPDSAKLASMTQTNDLVFGHGNFMCLGRPVAQMELLKTIFEVLRNFELALNDPVRPWRAKNCMGLFVISDMWVQVTERI